MVKTALQTKILFSLALLMVFMTFFVGSVSAACNLFCTDCATCNAMITTAGAGQTICLAANITNWTGHCIDNPTNFNNKIFDCQVHRIDGDGTKND